MTDTGGTLGLESEPAGYAKQDNIILPTILTHGTMSTVKAVIVLDWRTL